MPHPACTEKCTCASVLSHSLISPFTSSPHFSSITSNAPSINVSEKSTDSPDIEAQQSSLAQASHHTLAQKPHDPLRGLARVHLHIFTNGMMVCFLCCNVFRDQYLALFSSKLMAFIAVFAIAGAWTAYDEARAWLVRDVERKRHEAMRTRARAESGNGW